MRSLCFAAFLTFIVTTPVFADAINVSNIATKVLRGPDRDGDVEFAIKCNVRNNSREAIKTVVTLQAVDSDGFELKSVMLIANLKAGEAKAITDKGYMPAKDFKQARWRLKD